MAHSTGIEPASVLRDRQVVSSRNLTTLGPTPEIRTQTLQGLSLLPLPLG